MLQTKKVEYFHSTVSERPGTGAAMLEALARNEVNLVAYSATPTGPINTLCTLFPEDSDRLIQAAQKEGLTLEGPHCALLVEGEDRIGALDEVFRKLYDASIDVYSSTAIASRKGLFGCLIYLRPRDIERAWSVLNE